MKVNRRAFLASAGVLAGTSIAGCSQLTGDEPLVFEATPASVPSGVLEATGYEENEIRDLEIDRTFEAGGQEREVVVTNWVAEYEKRVDMEVGPQDDQRGGVFTALSTPQIEIIGREFNPIADMSNEELADRVQEQYDGVENIEVDEEERITVLGETTTRTRFTAEAQLGGTDVEVYLHLSNPVESNGQFVVGVGGHPQVLSGEEDNIIRMIEEIQHEAE
jgi:hypothetical protein